MGLIDAFADPMDIKRLGFTVRERNDPGRPAFEFRNFTASDSNRSEAELMKANNKTITTE